MPGRGLVPPLAAREASLARDLLNACRTKASIYTAREIEFLRSISTPHQLANLAEAQREWLEKLAARERIDFERVNASARAVLLSLCQRWLPDGTLQGREYVARNPTRADHTPGSFRINVQTGKWADFATTDKGGDPISLAAYLFHSGDQFAAGAGLKRMLGA